MCITSGGKVMPSKVTSVKQRTISTATSTLSAPLSTVKKISAVTKSVNETAQSEEEATAKDKKRKAYLSKGSEVVASFEKAEQNYSQNHPIEGKLIEKN